MPASAPPPNLIDDTSSTPPGHGTSPDESGSAILRFGTAVGASAIAALACVVPATMRVGSMVSGGGAARVWVALAAAALGPAVVAVVVLRGAREGLRAFAGPGAALRAFGVGLWLALLLVAFTLLGSVLRATTHHHALAGVTFAFGALVIAAGSAIVCARLVAIARHAPPRGRRAMVLMLGFLAVVLLAWIGLRFVRAASHDAASYAAAGTVVDVLAFALGAFFASRPALATRRGIALFGPPVAVVIVALGVTTLRDASVTEAIRERAPAFAPAIDVLSGR